MTPSPEPPIGPTVRDPAGYFRDLLGQARDLAAEQAFRLTLLMIGVAAIAVTARYLMWRWRHWLFARDARHVTVHAPPEVDPASAHELWANLSGLLSPAYKRVLVGQAHLAYEYVWTAHTVTIRIWVPGLIPPGLVERAVEAAWPSARTKITNPPAPPLPAATTKTVTVGGRLQLARPDHLPLRTDHPADPQRALMGAASELAEGQHACLTVLARPVTGRRLSHARRAAAVLRGGHPAPAHGHFLDLITPVRTRQSPDASAYVRHPERAAEVRAILEKAREPQWETVIRYGLAAPSSPKAQRTLRGRAHGLAAAFSVFAGHNRLRRRRSWRTRTLLTRRWLTRGDLVSVTELAALAHLPSDPAVPGLERAGAKAVPPPPGIPVPGPHAKPLGVADAGNRQPAGLGVADSRQHLHVLGATGSGKSTLIAQMILSDAAAGRGTAVIDPKGDLINDVIARLPGECVRKVVLFDASDRHPPPPLNVLAGPDRDLAIDNVTGIFRRIFADFWGPRTDDILRAACLTLWPDSHATLADVPRLLSDPRYRLRHTARVRDPVLADFWTWFDALSDGARAHASGPIVNKLRAVLLRDFIRTSIASPATLNLKSVLSDGLLLARLPKGVLGADASSLFGSLLLAKVWETISARARYDQTARHDTSLFIDEAHNFLTLPHGLSDLLAEARGYRLSTVLAHQNLEQLPRELREAISANARNKIYFAVSPEDARDLERHVAPNLSRHDLAHLGGYQAAARLITGGAESPAFTLRTQPLPAPIPGRADLVRETAREAWAGPLPIPAVIDADPRFDKD